MENNVIIIGFSEVNKEGVVLHLNQPARLKTSTIASKEWYVSWDKIGMALFDGYTEMISVEDRNKLRNESLKGEG